MKNIIDLRSDTVTKQPEFMKTAMFNAVVGDDVYGDDPTVIELETLAAKFTGKEAALFVPSGTFGNQLALFTHCPRGSEVILGDSCHIIAHEVGGSAIIAGVQLRAIDCPSGMLNASDIEKRIRFEDDDIHFPSTSLICVENAHSSGKVIPLDKMKEIYDVAKKYNLPVHIDGARIFNAATSLNVDVKEITNLCDSVMFCLSKGLCAPVGSILAGDKDFIAKARKKRKLMGGGLRQAGFLAAAGLVALNDMSKRLHEDHENATILAKELSKLPELIVDVESVEINMVFFKFKDTNINTSNLVEFFKDNCIKINNAENGEMRFVTHFWITKNDISKIVETLKSFLAQ
ncbi:MAG: low-specificity L-threonine aldolase [Clostridium sp.]